MPPNGQTQRLQFKKRTVSHENRPDAPPGAWQGLIPKGRCKANVTPADKGGDPFLTIAFKIEKAEDEKNESFQGSELTQRLTFYDQTDPERRKAANANLRFAQGLADALDLELSDVYPDSIESVDDLEGIIAKIEGKRLPFWTTHRESLMGNGEKVINVDIRFKEPGSGLTTAGNDEDDADDRPGKRTAAKGSKGRR